MRRHLNFIFSILISVVLIGTGQVSVYAISGEQKRLYDSGIYFFDKEVSSVALSCSVGLDASFSGSEAVEVAFNFFREQGLTPEQSAGIVGNLYKESAVMPNRAQQRPGDSGIQTIESASEITPNRGFGIAQWTTAGRQQNWLNYADELGLDPLSLELQLLFLMHELETEPAWGYEQLRETSTLQEATWIFLTFFERPRKVIDGGYVATTEIPPPGNPAREELDDRMGYALNTLELYSENPVQSGVCGIGSTEEPNFAAIPSISVDNPPSGAHSSSNCSGGFTDGAASLRAFVIDTWSPPVTSVGGYSCRAMVCGSGSCGTSVHGLGRAIDIMIDGTTPEGLRVGDQIRNFLYNNAERLGIQRIIWDRGIWSANQDGWRSYSGPNPHTDHLHVEVNIEASQKSNLTEGLFVAESE